MPTTMTACSELVASDIIVLKDGMIAENGTHEQLLALGGVYAGLHRIQYEETSA